ncbi:MAG: cysteine synthase A [Thermodesulfobacteriota bacterium]
MASGIVSVIGNTPLVRLARVSPETGAQIWCKLESSNPGGSVKDRMCLAIVEALEREGTLRPGGTLVEASGGNTAISLAMIAAARGYELVLVMPESVPVERRRFLAAYGAEIVMTAPSNGMRGAVNRAQAIAESRDHAIMVNQFENPANPDAHRRTTAIEILDGLGKSPDVFVAGVGTGGTITGVGEVLKSRAPSTRVVAVEPADSPILSGGNPGPSRIPGIGAGFVPVVLNTGIIDEVCVVSVEDALHATRRLAALEGIFGGLSSGANISAAIRLARELEPDAVVVTVICDAGERYVSFNL